MEFFDVSANLHAKYLIRMNSQEITQIRMYVPEESSTGTYDVIKVSDFSYRLASNDPFSEILSYGTVIEVETEKKEDEGECIFVFKKIHTESNYTLEVIFLPMNLTNSEMRIVGQMIIDEGGFWEVIFGGVGYVNLPIKSNLNVIEELNKLIKTKQNNNKHKIKIEFGIPVHGWLPTTLKYGDYELEINISDVPLNPMTQLCNSLIQLLKGINTPDIIPWHLEPYCYYLQLKKTESNYEAIILESDRIDSKKKLTFKVEGKFGEIILPIYRSLKKFHSMSYQAPHWDEMELERMEDLTVLIKQIK